jgi:hypothetical protein
LAYKTKIVISLYYYPKYIRNIKKKKRKEKREKERKKQIVYKDVYWFLLQKTKQGKIGSNQLGINLNLIL